MLHLNKIAKSLDDRRLLLAACRKELEGLIERAQSDARLDLEVSLSAAALDKRCCASIKESIELYHRLALDPFALFSQIRATTNLSNAQTRLAREHQLIAAMIERLRKAPADMQLN